MTIRQSRMISIAGGLLMLCAVGAIAYSLYPIFEE
jgi:hypothetical protein